MENARCEICGCVLENDCILSREDRYRFGDICVDCLNKLKENDEYSEFDLKIRDKMMNNFSFWYPRIKDCGMKVPKSLIFKVPDYLYERFFLEADEDYEVIDKWIKDVVLPVLKQEKMQLLFVKNATFSNKFNASDCFTTPRKLGEAIASINYNALILGAGGLDELVIRECIWHNRLVIPCIYGGLPLRTEFRVFYDFSKKEVIFIENYWKFNYVFPNLYSATDKIVFEHERARIEEEFEKYKGIVYDFVSDSLKNVDGLEGPWSVDIMHESGKFYLIDMALAEMSTYWSSRPGNESVLAREEEIAARRKMKSGNKTFKFR